MVLQEIIFGKLLLRCSTSCIHAVVNRPYSLVRRSSFVAQTGIVDIHQGLNDGDIHIYLTRPDYFDLSDESILDTSERARANAFRFSSDRELYVAAHIFLRQTLSRYACLTPADWQFVANAYGKPFVNNANYEWLKFNLSHTQGLIACAVSHKREVGIDVEKRKSIKDLESLCQSVFSVPEATEVLSADNIQTQEQRFFTFWTLKEAYIKARGMGLSIPLSKFTFVQRANETWALHCDPTLRDDGKNWQFASYSIHEHHLSIGIKIDVKAIQPRFHVDECAANHSLTDWMTRLNSADNSC